jgi:hypothetical protein
MKNSYQDFTLQDFLRFIKRKRTSPILNIDIEIYQYFEEITNNFEIAKTKFVIGSIYNYYYRLIRIHYKIKEWEIPTKKDVCMCIESVYYNKEVEIYDYKKMEDKIMSITDGRERIGLFRELYIKRLIKFLESKLPCDTQKKTKQFHYTCSFTTDEAKRLYEGLTNNGFLPKETIYSHFCYVFGGTAISDNEKPFKPLKWLKNKQLLRELLTHDKIKCTLSIAEIERQTPNLFIDEHNRPLSLANNKPVPSTDSDILKKILATL